MEGQNPNRLVVTICDVTFKPQPAPDSFPLTVSDDTKNKDWDSRNIEMFEFLITHTILHEMIHASTNGRIDDRPDAQHAYNYLNGVQQKPEDAHLNAETMVYVS